MSAMRNRLRRILGKEPDQYDWPKDPRPAMSLVDTVAVETVGVAEAAVRSELYPDVGMESTPLIQSRIEALRGRLANVVMPDATEIVQEDYCGQPHHILCLKGQPTAILAVFPFSTRGQATADFVLHAADDIQFLLSKDDGEPTKAEESGASETDAED